MVTDAQATFEEKLYSQKEYELKEEDVTKILLEDNIEKNKSFTFSTLIHLFDEVFIASKLKLDSESPKKS